jgi:hypothetical protein
MNEVKQNILDKVKTAPDYAANNANAWFTKRIKDLGHFSRTELLKETKNLQGSRLFPGSMNFFGYDPLTKETLPYYDRFPLVLVISIGRRTFSGIAFHYLPIPLRVKLFERIATISTSKNLNQQRILQLTWEMLRNASRFPEVAPAIKQYRYDHIQTKVIRIPLDEMKIALFLPNEQFVKASASTVQRISQQMLSRRVKVRNRAKVASKPTRK